MGGLNHRAGAAEKLNGALLRQYPTMPPIELLRRASSALLPGAWSALLPGAWSALLLAASSALLLAASSALLLAASSALLLAACLWPAQAGAEMYAWTDKNGDLHFSDVPRHSGYKRYEPPPIRPQAASYDPRWLGRSWAWDADILRAGRKHEVSPALIKAVIHAESAFDPDATSRVGAGGLMQLMPITAREMGVRDRFDPAQNITGGTRYLKHLMGRFGDLELAVAAYNAGPEAVRKHGGVPPYRETRAYVRNVLGLYKQYRRDFSR